MTLLLLLLLLACADPLDAALDPVVRAAAPPVVDLPPPAPEVHLPVQARLLVSEGAVVVDARGWRDGLTARGAVVGQAAVAKAVSKPLSLEPVTDSHLLWAVYEALSTLRDAELAAEEQLGHPVRQGVITVRAAEGLTWEALSRVVYTAGQATYGEVRFEVVDGAGETHHVAASLPGIGGLPMGPRLAVGSTGVALEPVVPALYLARGRTAAPTRVPCTRPGCVPAEGKPGLPAYLEVAALDAALEQLAWPPAAELPEDAGLVELLSTAQRTVLVAPAADVPWGLVAPVLARGARAAEAGDAALVLGTLAEEVDPTVETGVRLGIEPSCDPEAALARRRHLPLAELSGRWLAVADVLTWRDRAVVGHLNTSTLTAWTAWPDGGFVGLYGCHGLDPSESVGRAEGDRQVLVRVGADGALVWSERVGFQDCCGHRWWSEVRLAAEDRDGDGQPELVLRGVRDEAGEGGTGGPAPFHGPDERVFEAR